MVKNRTRYIPGKAKTLSISRGLLLKFHRSNTVEK